MSEEFVFIHPSPQKKKKRKKKILFTKKTGEPSWTRAPNMYMKPVDLADVGTKKNAAGCERRAGVKTRSDAGSHRKHLQTSAKPAGPMSSPVSKSLHINTRYITAITKAPPPSFPEDLTPGKAYVVNVFGIIIM